MPEQRITVPTPRPAQRGDIMVAMTESDGLTEVVRLELELLDPARRGSAGRVGQLLHPDFVEHVVLLTYRLLGPSGSLRSSVRVQTSGTWLLRFHQGARSVLVPPADADLLTEN